ncbi:MAG: UDP-glucose 4-epimerase GalE [Bacteroidales bacterium]
MQKVLVTGGTGFIGSHTVVELIKSGYQVVILDNLSNSNEFILNGIEKIVGFKPPFYKADCTKPDELAKVFNEHHDINGVIHFAAYKAVKESIEKPLEYYQNNLLSLIQLLNQMGEAKVNNLVFSSSCTIYGEKATLPYHEELPMTPTTSPYGRTKQMCESIIADYANINNDFKYISLRYFNPIGAHPSGVIGELPIGTPNNLIPYITQTAAGVRDELKVFGDDYPTPDGTAMRDYIDVVDLAKAHVKSIDRIFTKPNFPNFEAFNLGSGEGVSVKEVIETFERENNIQLKWSYAPRRVGDIPLIYADTKKARKELGWTASTPLAQSLKNAWKWEKMYRDTHTL